MKHLTLDQGAIKSGLMISVEFDGMLLAVSKLALLVVVATSRDFATGGTLFLVTMHRRKSSQRIQRPGAKP
jgi:hypothetical protein